MGHAWTCHPHTHEVTTRPTHRCVGTGGQSGVLSVEPLTEHAGPTRGQPGQHARAEGCCVGSRAGLRGYRALRSWNLILSTMGSLQSFEQGWNQP